MGSSRRERIAGLLDRTGALDALVRLRAHAPVPWLTILAYHRFSDDGSEYFDDGVVDTTAEEFERQVVTMRKHFSLVGTEELCVFARGGTLPKNPVAITFDDGYRSVYEKALPILRRHDCPAIVFVATAFTSERRIHWWDRVAYVLKRSQREHVTLRYPIFISLHLADRQAAIRKVLRLIKAHPRLDVERLLTELADAAGVEFTREMDRAFADELLMTWDQLRELRPGGIDVESHTRTHRVLSTLEEGELTSELRGSRDDIARELGVAPRAVAYPIGEPLEPRSNIRRELLAAGYSIGLTNGTGPTPLGKPVDPFGIRRQTVGVGVSDAYNLAILALPVLARRYPWRAARIVVS
jgi:peptidoglycan/xylan/chitin deacetylase (PgdA/CDA1 family)